ncbi:MAG: hypothetical protein IPP90_05870 [Gemmatimonadaceae bacterium]|nr:hypothetical protein [Gemmatimonadaceae bacterium]
MSRARAGTGLLEVVVALPLMALLGVVAVQLLLGLHRQIVQADAVMGATRELRHGASVLAAELRPLRPSDLVAWSDTAVEFDGMVGLGIACASTGRTQVLIVGPDSSSYAPGPLAVIWNQPPQAGDEVELWLAPSQSTSTPRAQASAIRVVTSSRDCAHSPLRSAGIGEAVRIALVDTLPGDAVAGAPIRVTRRTRYSLYRGGDGEWYLGRRTRGPGGWDVVQPVAGPLRSARDRGLVIRVHDANGQAVDSASANAAARVSIEMRAPRRSGRATPRALRVDSVRIDVALRAERGGAA